MTSRKTEGSREGDGSREWGGRGWLGGMESLIVKERK